MAILPALLNHFELDYAQGFAAALASGEVFVIAGHQALGAIVADVPQAHELSFGSGQGKGAAQTVDALTIRHFAEAGLAGGEDHELSAQEVELGRFEGGEDAVFEAAAAGVEASEGETGAQKGIFRHDAARP